MSTRNPHNCFKISTIQKRDFGIRVIDIICQKDQAAAPFKAEKDWLNPFYGQKTGLNAHFIIGGDFRP